MNSIDGYTRICGVIGNPVEHTMSPVIHNLLAERTGKNLIYVPFHVQEGFLSDAIAGAFALNILGLNVTVPYKQDVIASLVDIDPLAERIGAVNTLVRVDQGYKGYNTDMPGLLRAFASDDVELKGQDVIILGAGGVARAVAMLLAGEPVASITIYNRTLERGEKIAKEVNSYLGREFIEAHPLEDYRKLPDNRKYVVIQTTNVGMHPKCDEAVIEEESFYQKISVGYDLIYKPLETRFMKLVKSNKGRAYNGLKMLLFQGIIAYELWTDTKISEELANMAYENLLNRMKNCKN